MVASSPSSGSAPPRADGSFGSTLARWFDALGRDVRLAVRGLVRSPLFAVLAVLTLALGIGANVAVFTLVDSVLLAPLPHPEPERLVQVWEVSRSGGSMAAAWANFEDWRAEADELAGLAAYGSGQTTILGTDRPLRLRVARVSEDFFSTLDTRAVAGRLTTAEDHRLGAVPVAVVSSRFFHGHLGASLDGRILDVGGVAATVVGVAEPGFDFPAGTDVWIAAELDEPTPHRTAHNWLVVGRLAEGETVAGAEARLDAITRRIEEEFGPDDYLPVEARVVPLREELVGEARTPLLLLLGAALLVLLVASANLASAFLARGAAREREMAVRSSLGASPGRLLGQLFVEGLVVAVVGAAAGVAVAWGVLRLFLALSSTALLPAALPRLETVRIDLPVLAFALVVAGGAAVLFSLLPGLWTARRSAAGALRTTGASADRGRQRAWRALVVVEVALAVVLLVGSGLLVRSLVHVLDQDLGYEVADVLRIDLDLPGSLYPDDPAVAAYHRELVRRLDALAAVDGIGVHSTPPLSGSDPNGRMDVEGGVEPTVTAGYRVVGPGTFDALDLPLVAGRPFDGRDHADAPHAVIVNRSLAEAVWPGRDPLGRRMTGGGMDRFWNQDRWATVVGVVEDLRHRGPTDTPRPEAYFPVSQRPGWMAFGSVLVEASPKATEAVRAVVRELDPNVPFEIAPLERSLGRSVAERRFAAVLLGSFAVLALVLAAVGIFGVVAWTVARRRHEMGIRLALGARPGGLQGRVIATSLGPVVLGLAVGLGASLPLARLLESLLWEIQPADPTILVTVVPILLTVALLASWLPARRAAAVDPAETLRG